MDKNTFLGLDLTQWPTDESGYEVGSGKRINQNPGVFLIARACFYPNIAKMLHRSCVGTLKDHGVQDQQILTIDVPGSFELSAAIAGFSQKHPDTDIAAAIALGCIIRGKSNHYDYVCSATANSLGHLGSAGKFPVIFGVLTTNTENGAFFRASPDKQNKGRDFALSALWMANRIASDPTQMQKYDRGK